MKEGLELLTCSISIGNRPLFVIEMFFETVVPRLTSPKSIVFGLTAISVEGEVVDEKALDSDPHPDNPRETAREAARMLATAAEH